jgi:MFS family permease
VSRRSVFLQVFPSIMPPMFLAVMDQIIAARCPRLQHRSAEFGQFSWVVVCYLFAGTVAAPVYGQVGDVIGRRRLMLVARPMFIAASLLCAASRSIEMLVFARMLQGFVGGDLMTLSQALIGESVPPRERGHYQSYLAAVVVCSNTFGPVVRGYPAQHFTASSRKPAWRGP